MLPAATTNGSAKLSYATYLPGPSVRHSAVDSTGAMYVSGPSYPECSSRNTGTVSKLKPDGSGLLWTRCFEGTVGGVAVDRTGSLYVASNVSGATILSKFDSDASRIIYSTAIPNAAATAIAADRGGNLFVTGTASPEVPATKGALSICGSTSCGFLARLGPDGVIAAATSTGSTGAVGIVLDSHSQPWIAGNDRASAIAPHATGYQFGYAAHYNSALTQGIGGGRFIAGWAGQETLDSSTTGISIDDQDAVYLLGTTCRVQAAPGAPYTISPRGLYAPNPAVNKYDASGKLVYSIFLPAYYAPYAAAGTPDGSAYIALSPTTPGSGARYCTGGLDAQISVLSPDGSKLTPMRPLGGTPLAYFSDGKGGLYMAGSTVQTAFLPTPGAYLTQYPGPGGAGFAAKLDLTQPAEIEVACVANAASGWAGRNSLYAAGAVAPGEVISIFGGPFQPDAMLRISFDGIGAPLLYASTDQINAVVPFQTGSAGALTNLQILQGDRAIWSYQLPVSTAVPGIFSILNQDGAANSSTTPAAPGSLVSVFLTGAGAYDQSVADGSPGPSAPPLPVPLLGADARISGRQPQIVSVAQAPGLVVGVVRMDLRLPDDLAPGSATLTVFFGPFPSPSRPIFISK